MAITFRGLAEFAGCPMVFDVILYASQAIQDADITDDFQSEKIHDSLGSICSERSLNEVANLNVNMKVVGDTAANARAINTISVGGFLPMQQTVNISQPAAPSPQMPAIFIGAFKVKSGQKINAKNAVCGDMILPLEKYVDPTQNALMQSIPA